VVGFRLRHNLFAYHVVGIALKPGFFAGKFLEMPLGAFCAPFLQALAQGMMPPAVVLDSLSAKGFTGTVRCQVHDAKVNTEGITRFLRKRCGNFQRHCQVEDALAVNRSLSCNES
jgi:hypothetical protein